MAKQHQDENELFDANNDTTASTPTNHNVVGSNAVKDPDEWTTGSEPMTGAQESYLKTLSDQAGVEFDTSLNKADASKKIEELQHKTGRGVDDQE